MKNKKVFISILVFTIICSTAFGLAQRTRAIYTKPEPGYSYRVYGYAKDSSSGAGISGATVKVYKDNVYTKTISTSSSGYFSTYITTLSAVSTFKIRISHPNYDTTARTKSASSSTYFGYVYMNRNYVEKYAVIVSYGVTASSSDINYWVDSLEDRGFSSSDIITISGSSVTVSNVRSNVQSLASRADNNDIIVFAYSGHGGNDYYGNSWLSLSDGDYHDNQLRNDLDDTAANHGLVFICSCGSGGFVDDFNGLSKFFVSTATDLRGITYGMEIVSTSKPWDLYRKSAQIGPDYSMWVHFFLANLDGSSLSTVQSNAISDYRSWWLTSKWTWKIYAFDGNKALYKWIYTSWIWNSGEEPRNPCSLAGYEHEIGAPMSGGSSFIL